MIARRSGLLAGVALVIAGSPMPAMAQEAVARREIAVSIPAGDLAEDLRRLAEAASLQLVYDARITAGKQSPGVSGTVTIEAAIARLLAGSNLVARFSGDRTVVITAPAASGAVSADGVRAIGVVNVEGSGGAMAYEGLATPANGINGSRDVEATEGTGNYTTSVASVASKIPQSLRETPQSVSVLTRARIEDQNIVSLRSALEALPGTTGITQSNDQDFTIYSRGFEIRSYSFDGGAPINYNYGNRPILNLSEYDSVQLIRGANGLFGGYSDPGGTINLVRKKPLDHNQLTYTQNFGSWSNFREEADLTGPVSADKSLRARVVLSEEDKDFFYRFANAHKFSAYGVLEYDLTSRTLLTFGASYNRERNKPNVGGLPRYNYGPPIDFPRSTCLCAPGVFDRADRTELFATLSHQFNPNLVAKINVDYNKEKIDAEYYYVSADVTSKDNYTASFYGSRNYNPAHNIAIDANITGKIHILGIEDEFALGANYRYLDYDHASTNYLRVQAVTDLFNFDPAHYTVPVVETDPALAQAYDVFKARETDFGAYGQMRIGLFKGFHALIGLRYSSYDQYSITHGTFDGTPSEKTALRDSSFSDPAYGLTYDFFKSFTLYGSHVKIYKPQFTDQRVVTDPPTKSAAVPPVTGVNDEVGIKWASANKKLNGSISYYRIVQKGFLTQDFNSPTGGSQMLLNDSHNEGVDTELTGELRPGWQVSVSYAYNNNTLTTESGKSPSTSFSPKNKAKLFTTYRFQSGSRLAGILIGGGVDYQSSSFHATFICSTVPPPDSFCPNFVPYNFTTNGYTTFSLVAGYRINSHFELSVSGNNITDVKTYESVPFQLAAAYNRYITPANFLMSIRARW